MKLFPVVHITESVDLAFQQAKIAFEAGADGVQLIDHDEATTERVIDTFGAIRESTEIDGMFLVGVNFLCKTPFQGFQRLAELEEATGQLPTILWADDYKESLVGTTEIRHQKPALGRVAYAGGVAFKYTTDATEDPVLAKQLAEEALPYVDIVVTSGLGTGYPPSPAKVDDMKRVIGNAPLAIASGITPSNVREYSAADMVFVSTSIEVTKGSGVFSTDALKDMVGAVRAVQ